LPGHAAVVSAAAPYCVSLAEMSVVVRVLSVVIIPCGVGDAELVTSIGSTSALG
jgi:hypothetical protein